MTTQINFPFHGYTNYDLMKFCYSEAELKNVDSSIPIDAVRELQQSTGKLNAHFWYVMDYNTHTLGELVNLKEKFFDVVATKAISKP